MWYVNDRENKYAIDHHTNETLFCYFNLYWSAYDQEIAI